MQPCHHGRRRICSLLIFPGPTPLVRSAVDHVPRPVSSELAQSLAPWGAVSSNRCPEPIERHGDRVRRLEATEIRAAVTSSSTDGPTGESSSARAGSDRSTTTLSTIRNPIDPMPSAHTPSSTRAQAARETSLRGTSNETWTGNGSSTSQAPLPGSAPTAWKTPRGPLRGLPSPSAMASGVGDGDGREVGDASGAARDARPVPQPATTNVATISVLASGLPLMSSEWFMSILRRLCHTRFDLPTGSTSPRSRPHRCGSRPPGARRFRRTWVPHPVPGSRRSPSLTSHPGEGRKSRPS